MNWLCTHLHVMQCRDVKYDVKDAPFVSADVREQALRHQVHGATTVQPARLVQWLTLLLATSLHPVSWCWPYGQPPEVCWRPGHSTLYCPHHLARPGSGEYLFTLWRNRNPTPMGAYTGYFARNLLTLGYVRDILKWKKKLELKFFGVLLFDCTNTETSQRFFKCNYTFVEKQSYKSKYYKKTETSKEIALFLSFWKL